jgi:capsular exopolysaccharide synthesis family protein
VRLTEIEKGYEVVVMKKEQSRGRVSLVALSEKYSNVAEQYRAIRSNIRFSSVDRPLKSMVVTSAGPGEGKSTTAANLAIIFANSGKRVLLVDADLRKPSVADSFQILNAKGLSNLLIDSDVTHENLVYQMSVDNLWIMPSGPKPPNPSELLGSQRMIEVIEKLTNCFDLVIFDMPPVVTVTDAQIVAAKVDGTLFVVRERKTNKQMAQKAKKLLMMANANVLGVVYNATSAKDQKDYYYGN